MRRPHSSTGAFEADPSGEPLAAWAVAHKTQEEEDMTMRNEQAAGVPQNLAPDVSDRTMVRLLMAIDRAEGEARRAALRPAVFDLLNRAGFERVEVEFDGYEDEGQVQGLKFFTADGEAPADAVPFDTRYVVEQYVYASLGRGWETNGGCFGTVKFFPKSEFAFFDHHTREVTWEPFEDGKPGPEVPEEDRLGGYDDE
jgi:hypothetical protein